MKLTNVVLFVVSSLAFPVSAQHKEKGSPLRKLAKKAGKKEGKTSSGKKSSALSPVSPVVSTDSALSLLLTSDTYDALAINSPQKMAIDWILGEAGLAALLEPDQSNKLLQVLSTAVIYFSTGGGGAGWSNSLGSLTGVDPCLWKPINQLDVRGYACDADGKVIGLELGTFA
jgi:hypothetical protein